MSELIQNPHLDGGSFYWKSGPVGFLLIHGFTASTAEVRLLAEHLFTQGHTISAPLLPGHNTKPEDLNHVTWQEWFDEVEQAYIQLRTDCGQVFVGGESTGGLLALFLASCYPEICGVLAYALALKLNISWFNKLRLYLFAPFLPYVHKNNIDTDRFWKGYVVNPLKGTIQLLRLQNVVKRRLDRIYQPILVIHGKLDTTVHPSVPEMIRANVKSNAVEIYWMDNSSHCVILDKERDTIFEITTSFINSVLKTNSRS